MKKIPPYDPTNDLIFKFVFGREERKRVTLTCINDLLGRTGKDAFVDLNFRNVELIPAMEDEKHGRLDVFAPCSITIRESISRCRYSII